MEALKGIARFASEIMGGTPVFADTHGPLQTLISSTPTAT